METYLAWLKDAHAMELGLVSVLETQVEETSEKPEMQAKIKDHLEKTKKHAELVESCLKRHDESPSGAKDIASKFPRPCRALA